MPSTSISLRVQPFRLLKKAEAANYCGLPVKAFDRVCPVRPLDMGQGSQLYDVQDLDLWIDGKKGGAPDDDEILGRLK